jgi:sigma-54 dependent transcriptional regulator, flagellar regulatory protein
LQGSGDRSIDVSSHSCSAVTKSNPLIGESPAMQHFFERMRRVAPTDATVLITGETGTGKGMVAQQIHHFSGRRQHRFMAINCGAIPPNLLESELFGHSRGAFTGANVNKIGKFEAANFGTIFLDEIGDMSADLQVKLLKVLEERAFEPVGSNRTVKVDVRIIAATHRDLEAAVADGRFREDLYYRLFVIPIRLPALRERSGDIPRLADHFLRKFNAQLGFAVPGFADEAMARFEIYRWPGNVRELANMVERLVVLAGDGVIGMDDLPTKLRSNLPPSMPIRTDAVDSGINLQAAVTAFEKKLICQSLEKTNWVKTRAADLLHIKRTTLVEKIKRYDLQKTG